MKFHGFGAPWKVLTPAVAAAKGKVIAAVAYVGTDGPEVLPLKAGDVLICDASPVTVASGGTSVAALRKYIGRGVEVYSHPGLHAKVVLLPRRLFVGSANASGNSRNRLDEAIIETTNRDTIVQAQQFTFDLIQPYERLSAADLAELSTIKVAKRPASPERISSPTTVPAQVPRMWIAVVGNKAWTKTSDAVYESERRRVGRQARRSGQAMIAAIEWTASEAVQLRPDDWIVHILGGRMYAPARVVKVSPSTTKYSLVWIATPSTGPRSVYVKNLPPQLRSFAAESELICWTSAKTRTICAVFQPRKA